MTHCRSSAVGRVLRILAAATLLVVCASCGHFESVSDPDIRAEELVGHEVRITKTDGRVLVFRVLEVTEDAFVGEFHRARFDEIAAVERHDYDVGKAAGLLMVAAGAWALWAALTFRVGG
jgi:hypothetical protein